jgi:hypothetical protein
MAASFAVWPHHSPYGRIIRRMAASFADPYAASSAASPISSPPFRRPSVPANKTAVDSGSIRRYAMGIIRRSICRIIRRKPNLLAALPPPFRTGE